MDFLINIGFFSSTYSIIIISVLLIFIFSQVKQRIPKIQIIEKYFFSLLILAILIFPSIPRYKFEKDTLQAIENQKWLKILKTTYFGSLSEPLTWFLTPIGFFHIVMPNPNNYGMEMDSTFFEVFFQYKEEERHRLVHTDCKENAIMYSIPKDGIYVYTSNEYLKMTDKEKSLFCDTDWSMEKEELRNYFARLLK